jgi:rhamnulose-1-phosphate aldolase
MPLDEPYPELEELLTAIGEAGQRVSDIDASAGAAGNISLFVGWPVEVRRRFPVVEQIALPQKTLALAGRILIVSGSGRRLRDIHKDPAANLGAVVIDDEGRTARLHTARAASSSTSRASSTPTSPFTTTRSPRLARTSTPSSTRNHLI